MSVCQGVSGANCHKTSANGSRDGMGIEREWEITPVGAVPVRRVCHNGSGIAVVVLVARRNKFEFLRPLVPELQRVLHEVRPGEVRRVGVWTEKGPGSINGSDA